MNSFEQSILSDGLVRGHFVLRNGNHTDIKYDFDRISRRFSMRHRVAKSLGELIRNEFPECDAVVTVANGANSLAMPTAQKLSKVLNKPVAAHKTTKTSRDSFFVQHNPTYIQEVPPRAVIVDDVYNHGTNSAIVAKTLEFHGANILGVAVVLNRNESGQDTLHYDDKSLAIKALIDYPMSDWLPEECACLD